MEQPRFELVPIWNASAAGGSLTLTIPQRRPLQSVLKLSGVQFAHLFSGKCYSTVSEGHCEDQVSTSKGPRTLLCKHIEK